MTLNIIPVIKTEQLTQLADLAGKIWHEYFTAILSLEQIDYMVERFQSCSAMTQQIENQGYEYYFINQEGRNVGYIGMKEEDGQLFLSKLYLQKEERGKGYASQAFEFLQGLCLERNLKTIWLTVNRFNKDTIQIYKRKGFQIVKTQVTDIGQGFIMDDYVMEKTIV